MEKKNGSFVTTICLIVLLITSIVVSAIVKTDVFISTLSLLMGCAVYLKCTYLVMYSCGGWKTRKAICFLGMPLKVFIIMFTIAIPQLFLVWFVLTTDLSVMLSASNLISFTTSVVTGYILSVVSWYAFVKKDTEKFSEYEARMYFKSKNYSDKEIATTLIFLKSSGSI